jgi:hypothetical protein
MSSPCQVTQVLGLQQLSFINNNNGNDDNNNNNNNKVQAVAQCLRSCTTNQKVAGLIPDYVIRIFHRHNPFFCAMALGLTQPPIEMSIRNISWGVKAAGAWV